MFKNFVENKKIVSTITALSMFACLLSLAVGALNTDTDNMIQSESMQISHTQHCECDIEDHKYSDYRENFLLCDEKKLDEYTYRYDVEGINLIIFTDEPLTIDDIEYHRQFAIKEFSDLEGFLFDNIADDEKTNNFPPRSCQHGWVIAGICVGYHTVEGCVHYCTRPATCKDCGASVMVKIAEHYSHNMTDWYLMGYIGGSHPGDIYNRHCKRCGYLEVWYKWY